MQKFMLTAAAIVLAVGCTSIDNRVKAKLIPPELEIRQINGIGGLSRALSGPMPVNFQVQVANRSNEVIRLERLEVQSMGEGAYTVQSASRPFKNVSIDPGKTGQVEFWAPAVLNNTISGANGPVTLRVVAYFDTDLGQFREIYVRNVNDTISSKPRVD